MWFILTDNWGDLHMLTHWGDWITQRASLQLKWSGLYLESLNIRRREERILSVTLLCFWPNAAFLCVQQRWDRQPRSRIIIAAFSWAQCLLPQTHLSRWWHMVSFCTELFFEVHFCQCKQQRVVLLTLSMIYGTDLQECWVICKAAQSVFSDNHTFTVRHVEKGGGSD